MPFSWERTHLVVVSGSGPNVCGHAVLNAGAYYFHVDGLNGRPWYMPESGYLTYLKENQKKELFRRKVPLPNPIGAQQKLEELSARNWRWLGIPNNCVAYLEEIFKAGGSNESLTSNCPVRWK